MHPIVVSASRAIAATCLVACANVAFAQAADPAPAAEAPHRHGPSPEAFAACASKAANDTCSFTARRGTITGQCTAPRKPAAHASSAGGAGTASGAAAGTSTGNSTAANGSAGGTSTAAASAAPAQLVCRPDHAAKHAHDNSGSK